MGRRQPEVAAACAARWRPPELQVLAMEASGLLLLQGEEAPAAGLPRNAARAGVVARLPPEPHRGDARCRGRRRQRGRGAHQLVQRHRAGRRGAQAVESAVGEEEEDGTGRTKRAGVAPGLCAAARRPRPRSGRRAEAWRPPASRSAMSRDEIESGGKVEGLHWPF